MNRYDDYMNEAFDVEHRTEHGSCEHCNNYRMCDAEYHIYEDEEVLHRILCKECQEK